jgi:hypothetical protein
MNEIGNASFFSLVLLMLFSIFGIQLIKERLDLLKDLKNKQVLLLCTKEINGKTSILVQNINSSNNILKLLTIGEKVSILIPLPGINLTTKAGIKSAIKALKTYQESIKFSYLNFLRGHLINKCSISLNSFKTPFKYKSFSIFFKRDKFNRTMKRKNNWKIKTSKNTYQIISTLELQTMKFSSKLKRVNPYLLFP